MPAVTRSKAGVDIELTRERWNHIITSYLDMTDNEDLLLKTVEDPDMILKGVSDEMRAVRFFQETHFGPRYLMAAYKELSYGEGFIITAYKTTKVAKIVKRGVLWRK
jgi:hypothetical protein